MLCFSYELSGHHLDRTGQAGRPALYSAHADCGRGCAGWLAAGQTHAQIREDFPELTEDDIRACLAYAADRERRLITAPI